MDRWTRNNSVAEGVGVGEPEGSLSLGGGGGGGVVVEAVDYL